MESSSTHDGHLVFGDLLDHLSRHGFRIGIDHHLRLQELLNKISGTCSPSDLKTLLCPVFATNKTQQQQFYDAFDSYLDLFLFVAPEIDSSSTAVEWYPTVLGGYQPLAVRKWPYVVAGAIVVVGILISGWFIVPTQTMSKAVVQTLADQQGNPTTPAIQPETKPANSPPQAEAPIPKPDDPPQAETQRPKASSPLSFYQLHGNAIRLAAILAPLIFFLSYESYRFKRRKLVLQKQRGKKSPFVWPIVIKAPAPKLFDSEQFYTAARLMRRRQVDEFNRLDEAASVAATIEALGYPTFRYRAASKMPEYLVLIERASFRDHQAELFNVLAKALEGEAVFVLRYFYDGDPRICRAEAGESIHLVELQRKYSGHRLLIFGNGEKLIDPISGKTESWTSLFSEWHERAVLTPENPSRWGVREIALSGLFLIAPATLEGVTSVIDQFESLARPDLRAWRLNSFDSPPELEQPNLVESLRNYLGVEAFQWLCACAVYPELHWDLTLHLGSLDCMKAGLVRERNLRSLVRLPWFRGGVIPDDLRWLLIRELDRDKETAIRSAIIGLLEKNPPPSDSFAADSYQLNLVVERWLHRPNRKTRREMLQVARSLPASQVARDYTLLRFLEASPNSPLDVVLPGRLHKLFYRNGVSALGPKTGARLLMTLAAIIIAWLVFQAPRTRYESIAVLPFANQTGDPKMEAITDEITEGVINHLYDFPGIRVISYGAIEQYKGKQIDLGTVGRELGVSVVMIGRVSKRDDVLTLNTELIDVRDRSRIWGDQEKLKFSDLMLARYRLARDVFDKLGVNLTEEQRKLFDAEELYETGRSYWNKRTTEAVNKAIDYFDRAIELKPDYAAAHAGLADCYNRLATYGALAPDDAFHTSEFQARKALFIDDNLAEAHVALGYALFRGDWNWFESEKEFRRAIQLNSRSAQARELYANLLVALGRTDDAIAQTTFAQELDSTSLIIRSQFGFVYFFAHRYDESITASQKVLELDSTFFVARQYSGQAYAQKGRYQQAISEFQKAYAGSGGSPFIKAELAHTYAIAGMKDDAQKIVAELQEQSTHNGLIGAPYISPYHIALIHAGLGQKDEAFRWLARAYDQRADYIVFLNVDPRFDGLHSDPRFTSLLQRVGLLSAPVQTQAAAAAPR